MKCITVLIKMYIVYSMFIVLNAGSLKVQEAILHNHNVIVLIPDGCGVAHMTIARWCKGAPLAQDSMDVSLVKTYSANSMITGSAAAATAFAAGYKTWEASEKARCLSMRPDSLLIPAGQALPEDQQWRPAATVLEGARLSGKAVGLVATCRASHATPAAYASHWHSRYDDNIIMEQIVYHDLDVLFAGGYGYLVDMASQIPGSTAQGKRRDGENLYEVLHEKGYTIITTRDELNCLSLTIHQVWGMFAPDHMVHDIDRERFAPQEPSLAEMTKKAIDILSKDPYGFFLMVEGSQVDWSSHDNDPVGTITDYLAFDRAVQVALDFARSQPEQHTLILVLPDHDNGGMSLGHRDTYSYMFHPNEMTRIVSNAQLTAEGVAHVIEEKIDRSKPSLSALQDIIAEHYGIDSLNSDEMKLILAELADTHYSYLPPVLGPILSARAGIGWTTFDHTGNDVPMFSYGCDRVPQVIDNTDVALLCARAMGFDLDELNERLFVDARVLFKDAVVTIDTSGVSVSNGRLIIDKKDKKAEFPFFKNIMIMDKDTFMLEGLTVYSLPAHRVFLPRQAKKMFESLK
jgi:alkaline phosphatase